MSLRSWRRSGKRTPSKWSRPSRSYRLEPTLPRRIAFDCIGLKLSVRVRSFESKRFGSHRISSFESSRIGFPLIESNQPRLTRIVRHFIGSTTTTHGKRTSPTSTRTSNNFSAFVFSAPPIADSSAETPSQLTTAQERFRYQ